MGTSASSPSDLTARELARYARHLSLPEVGVEGQRKLKAARVLCVGAGGLGSPLALYLAAAGVGALGIVDFDTVEESNLQRQVLHSTGDVGRLKVDSAAEKLAALNPHIRIVKHAVRLSSANALEIFSGYDIIADGSDNFPTRYLVNDACVLTGKPLVFGAVSRFDGQASVFCAPGGPCYRCLFPDPPPAGAVLNCAEGGVLGVLPGLVGVIQAAETIKIILGAPHPLIGRLLLIDAWGMTFREFKLKKNKNCPACGENPTVTALMDYQQLCGMGKETSMAAIPQMQVEELKRRIDAGEDVVVLDVREPHEVAAANLKKSKPDVKHIPLGDLGRRMSELDEHRNAEIVVHCRSGARSQNAAEQMQAAGFAKVHNLAGGIQAWSDRIDPTVDRY
jgi:molybdopterin/thiamine biosynthesis adenylyltransferase/rhodanese-related sulfurtransferase